MDLNSNICIICKKSGDLPVLYGEFLKKSKIHSHYYCLLFAHNLQQKGKDNAGLLGFQINDIKKYSKSITDKICVYCNETSASAKCDVCQKDFHFICGIENRCQFLFVEFFKSYCHLHVQIQHEIKHPDNQLCEICLQVMGEYHPVLSIVPKCCPGKWLHRTCLMKYALSAGYYVKCFWCKSKNFRDQIRLEGIFVPDRDASWEREPNAYADLYRPYRECNATDCLCPGGRKYNKSRSGIWSIILCCMCGAYPLHRGCFESSSDLLLYGSFICNDCQLIRTSRSLIVEDFNASNTNPDTNIVNDDEKSSELDKTLYLVKSLNPGISEINYYIHNNVNQIFENKGDSNIKINENQMISEDSDYEMKSHYDDSLTKFYFEKGNLRGTICGTLKKPTATKLRYSIDEITPKVIKFDTGTDSSSDSEIDEEDKKLFLSIILDELRKEGKSKAEIEKIQKKKKKKKKDKKESQIYFLQSEKNVNLKAIMCARSTTNEKLDKEKFELDKMQIEKSVFFESELDFRVDHTGNNTQSLLKILED